MGPLSRGLLIKFFNIPFVRRQFHYFLSDKDRLAWLNRRIQLGQIFPGSDRSPYPTLLRDLDFVFVSPFSYTKDIWRVGDMVLLIEPKRTNNPGAQMQTQGPVPSSFIAGFEGYCGYMKTGRRGLPDSKVIVPRGHCWTQHDGPAHLPDSRLYGPVPLASLLGKFIWRLGPQHFCFIDHDPNYVVRSPSQSPISTTGQPIRPDATPQSPGPPPDLLSETIPQANTSPKARLRYSASRTVRQESVGRNPSKKN